MISIKKRLEHNEKAQLLSEYLKIDSELGRSDSDDSPEDTDDAAKERALTSLLRKLAYEDFSALEKAATIDDDTCTCDSCKDRRAWTNETLEEFKLIQSYWLELRQYLRIIYRLGMKGSIKSVDENYHAYMKDLVSRLCEVCNPHQLYQRLEAQVREFVTEMKMRLLQLMDTLAENPQLPRLFISGMLDRYNKMMNAAKEITPVLSQLETEHLSKFNLTWKMLNQRLFQTSIYTDPFFQNSVPVFTSQLSKSANDSEDNKTLIREFLSFDDEITLVEGMWKDVENRIHQYTKDHAVMSRQRFLKEEYLNDLRALRRVRLKNCNNNGIESSEIKKDIVREDREGEECISIESEDICECHVCLDASAHTPVDLMDQVVSPSLHGGGFHLYPHIHGTGGDFSEVYTESLNLKVPPPTEDHKSEKNAIHRATFSRPESQQSVNKTVVTQKRVDKATQKDNEIYIAPELDSSSKTQDRKQNSVCIGTRPTKDQETSSESNHHQHACLKHSDTIKRIPCPEQEDEANTGNNLCSNHEDTHSESSQPDPRHCDCCYCEVFGHGIPSAAPMSRNYQEMRERLRLLLNKKKSKCKSNSESPQPPSRASKHHLSKSDGGTKSGNIGDRDLEDLLIYIEGTDVKCRNEKRAAKKARQREKKQILIQNQKQQEEEKAMRLKEALEVKRREEALAKAAREEKESQGKSKKKPKTNSHNNQKRIQVAKKQHHISIPSSPGPQMVTIKRVMEPHNSEPTVTITLRGATPNQDKVLYTLLNGQVCKVKDQPKIMTKSTKQPYGNGLPLNGKINGTYVSQIESQPHSGKKTKPKKEVQHQSSSLKQSISSNPKIVDNPSEIQINNAVNNFSSQSIHSKPFNLEDIKLPPGITITKVDANAVNSKSILKERQPHKFPTLTQIKTPPASEVIVVATGKLKEATQVSQLKDSVTQSESSKKKKNNNTRNELKKADLSNGDVNVNFTTVQKKKKNKKKGDNSNNDMLSQNSHIYPGIDIEPVTSLEQDCNPSISICPTIFQTTMNKSIPVASHCLEQGKKKKKKSKKIMPNTINPEELSLLDSVFAPKDIDLDDGEMDDDERELEAFKRFCSQSVPPKQKEKVHLNLKDIVLKKKSSAITCS